MKKKRVTEQSFGKSLSFAFGVILLIVGIIGFGPAGPFPIENVALGTIIWLSLTIVPTAIGGLLLWYSSQ